VQLNIILLIGIHVLDCKWL